MAVIQISRIQVRRGQVNQDGLPQLASGEIGWAIDAQELYIGNGSVAEGAPFVGNTRILTENDLFTSISLSTPYIFSATTTLVTGIDGNHPTIRSMQSKLDENVSVHDFGVTSDTTSTRALQRAIDEIFLNSGKTNQPLRIPAGTYYVTSTIYIPKNTNLVGDGIDKTIIISLGTGADATVFRTHGGTSVSRTTGTSIQSTDQPGGISISGITFMYTSTTLINQSSPLIIIDGCENSKIVKNKFIGIYQTGENTNVNYTGIELQGVLTKNISLEDNIFSQLVYPTYSDYDINEINIKDNLFESLYQGVTLSKSLTGTGIKQFGPKNVQIKENTFKHIEREGIYVGISTSTGVAIQSKENTFIDVGNGNSLGNTTTNNGNALTPIITFNAPGCSSRDDNFERFSYFQTAVGLTKRQRPLVDGAARFELKYAVTSKIPSTLTPQTLLSIPYPNTGTNITIDYIINKSNRTRTGQLSVLCGSSQASIKDEYTYVGNDDGFITFTADLVDTGSAGIYNSALIQYVNPFGSGTGTCVATLSAVW